MHESFAQTTQSELCLYAGKQPWNNYIPIIVHFVGSIFINQCNTHLGNLMSMEKKRCVIIKEV